MPAVPAPKAFPLSVDDIIKATPFNDLAAAVPAPLPELPKVGESEASKNMRKTREEQARAAKEKLQAAKDAMLAKIRETIQQKISEINSAVEDIAQGAAEIAANSTTAVQIKTDEAALSTEFGKNIAAVIGPAAPAADGMKTTYAQTVASMENQISTIKASLSSSAARIDAGVETIVGTCSLLGIAPIVSAFITSLQAVQTGAHAAVSAIP